MIAALVWHRAHGKNLDWYLRLSRQGVKPKPLETYPILLEVDVFYYQMYSMCGHNLSDIVTYCRLYKLSDQEILESIEILTLIKHGAD